MWGKYNGCEQHRLDSGVRLGRGRVVPGGSDNMPCSDGRRACISRREGGARTENISYV